MPKTKTKTQTAAARARVVGPKQRGRTKPAGPFPATIVREILRPTFLYFLRERGVDVAALKPSGALAELVAYYDQVRVEYYSPGKADQLLFEARTFEARTSLALTRQLYAGAGSSFQLQLTFSYAAGVRVLNPLTLWSQRCGSVGDFAKRVRDFLSDQPQLASPKAIKVALARF